MSLRDWLVLVGIIVIVGVLVDGYRRMRLARRRASELSFGLEEVKGVDENFGSELPNGGARRTGSSGETPPPKKRKPAPEFVSAPPRAERIEPEISGLEERAEPDFDLEFAQQDHETIEPMVAPMEEPVPVLTPEEEVMPEPEPVFEKPVRQAAVKPKAPEPKVAPAPQPARVEPVKAEAPKFEKPRQASKEKLADRPEAQEVLVINVLAKGEEIFDGSRLLQSLLSSGMRFGDMSIFHRYENSDGTGRILFSMADGVKPGTFDIDRIEAKETPAVSFFMGMPGPKEPLKAFMMMEETAKQLALDLGGELKDENLSVMTQQTLEHCRQTIREFERKRLTQKLSD